MFRATPVFAYDESASDLSDTSSVDSGNSTDSTARGSLGSGSGSEGAIHACRAIGAPDFTPGEFQCELCVPYVTAFFSQEAVTVKYNVNVLVNGRRWSLDKRFSELLILHRAVKDMYDRHQPIGNKVSHMLRGGTRTNPLFPSFPSRRLFSGSTNTSIKAILARRADLNTYFQVLTNPEFGFLCSKQLNAYLYGFVCCPNTSSSASKTSSSSKASQQGSTRPPSDPGAMLESISGERSDIGCIAEREHVNAFFRVPEKFRVCHNIEWVRAAAHGGNPSSATTTSPTTPQSVGHLALSPTGNNQPHHRASAAAAAAAAPSRPTAAVCFALGKKQQSPTRAQGGSNASSFPSAPLTERHRRRGTSLWRREASCGGGSSSSPAAASSFTSSSSFLTDRATSGGTYVVEPAEHVIAQMGAIPTLCIGLPNAKLCFDDSDPLQMLVVLRCKKVESRISVVYRHEELLAFYGYVVHRALDALPDISITKAFFRRYQELHPLKSSSVASVTSLASVSRERHPGRGRPNLCGVMRSVQHSRQASSADSSVGGGWRSRGGEGGEEEGEVCSTPGLSHANAPLTGGGGGNDDDEGNSDDDDALPVVSLAALSRSAGAAAPAVGRVAPPWGRTARGAAAAGAAEARSSALQRCTNSRHLVVSRRSRSHQQQQQQAVAVSVAEAAQAEQRYSGAREVDAERDGAEASSPTSPSEHPYSPMRHCQCTNSDFCPVQGGSRFDTSCGRSIVIHLP